MEFGERLIAARKAKGMSQEDLAGALDISRQAISKWENGESKPDLDNLISLCRCLGLSMEYLCLGKDQSAEPERRTPPRVSRKWIAVSVCVILCLAASFVIGMWVGRSASQIDVVPDAQEETQNSEELLRSIEIVDATVTLVEEDTLRILFSSVPEGLSVELLLDNKNFSDGKSILCQPDGLHFSAPLQDLLPRTVYHISAVLTLEGVQRVLPVMTLELDTVYNTCSTVELWK